MRSRPISVFSRVVFTGMFLSGSEGHFWLQFWLRNCCPQSLGR